MHAVIYKTLNAKEFSFPNDKTIGNYEVIVTIRLICRTVIISSLITKIKKYYNSNNDIACTISQSGECTIKSDS